MTIKESIANFARKKFANSEFTYLDIAKEFTSLKKKQMQSAIGSLIDDGTFTLARTRKMAANRKFNVYVLSASVGEVKRTKNVPKWASAWPGVWKGFMERHSL